MCAKPSIPQFSQSRIGEIRKIQVVFKCQFSRVIDIGGFIISHFGATWFQSDLTNDLRIPA
jgi:hypothetical protein